MIKLVSAEEQLGVRVGHREEPKGLQEGVAVPLVALLLYPLQVAMVTAVAGVADHHQFLVLLRVFAGF